MENEQKKYEIGYLISPLVAEEAIDDETLVLRQVIESKHGLIIIEGRPKMQKLAYPVKGEGSPTQGFETAYFGWMKFTLDSEVLSEVKDNFDKNRKVVRFLITVTPKEGAPKKIKPVRIKKIKPTGEVGAEEEGKSAIKPEEIDKKLEELIAV